MSLWYPIAEQLYLPLFVCLFYRPAWLPFHLSPLYDIKEHTNQIFSKCLSSDKDRDKSQFSNADGTFPFLLLFLFLPNVNNSHQFPTKRKILYVIDIDNIDSLH